MVTNDSYSHGDFSWTDVSVPDPAAGKAFYSELFGHDFSDVHDDSGGTYTMVFKRGIPVWGLMELTADMASAGVPPCWTTYITVDDIEEALQRVPQLGGTPMSPINEVEEAGRFFVFADPSGAVAILWETIGHFGHHIVDEHGTMCWHELQSGDIDSAMAFYSELLGWTGVDLGMDGLVGIRHNGAIIATASPLAEGVPAHWAMYFAVDDCDETVESCNRMGGSTLVPAMDLPPGRMALIADNQGAPFWVVTPNPDFSMS